MSTPTEASISAFDRRFCTLWPLVIDGGTAGTGGTVVVVVGAAVVVVVGAAVVELVDFGTAVVVVVRTALVGAGVVGAGVVGAGVVGDGGDPAAAALVAPHGPAVKTTRAPDSTVRTPCRHAPFPPDRIGSEHGTLRAQPDARPSGSGQAARTAATSLVSESLASPNRRTVRGS